MDNHIFFIFEMVVPGDFKDLFARDDVVVCEQVFENRPPWGRGGKAATLGPRTSLCELGVSVVKAF